MKAGLCEECPSTITTVASIPRIVLRTANTTDPYNNVKVRSDAIDSGMG
jgi:hypothetical protein